MQYSEFVKLQLERGLFGLIKHQFILYFPWYLFAIISLVLTHYLGSFLPFYAKELADLVNSGVDSISTSKYFLLAIGIIIFRSLSRILFFYPPRIVEKDMRLEILGRIESTHPSRYKKYSPGQLFQILYTDIEEIRTLLGFAFLQLGNILIAIVIFIPKIYFFNHKLIIALIPMILCSVIFSWVVSKTRHYYRKSADLQGEVQNFIMETYSGKQTIKNFHAEKSFLEIFQEKSLKELFFSYKAGNAVSYTIPLIPLGLALSFLLGAYFIKVEDLGASSLILFSGFVFLFLEPLMFLAWVGVVFSSSFASWGRIKELIVDLKVESPLEKDLREKNKEDKPFVLSFWGRDLELNVLKNKWTVIIGKTGCGKSELLLQVATILKQQNKRLSYVGQNPYIYNDTLKANLFLGKDPTPKECEVAMEFLKLFSLDFLSEDKLDILNLRVGENGKRLSGGQAKRVCLIRSLLSDSDFYLWDDPFSSVDLILEKEIIIKLKGQENLKTKAFLLTTHRISTVKNCDFLYLVDQEAGIIEEGETGILLKEKSMSYDYFEKQMV